MGISRGRYGFYQFATNTKHRKHALKTLATKRLTGKRLNKEISKYVNDDVLSDKPTKKNAARLFLWLSWYEKIDPADMAWVEPFMHYAKVHDWDVDKDAYGDAAAYGRVVSAFNEDLRDRSD